MFNALNNALIVSWYEDTSPEEAQGLREVAVRGLRNFRCRVKNRLSPKGGGRGGGYGLEVNYDTNCDEMFLWQTESSAAEVAAPGESKPQNFDEGTGVSLIHNFRKNVNLHGGTSTFTNENGTCVSLTEL